MKYYIAYGSNLNLDQMFRRCPGAIVIGSAVIKGHKLVFRGNSRSGVANIEPSAGEQVPVGIWAITPDDEVALDRYEGYPFLYTKKFYTVTVNGRRIRAMAYIMTPGHRIEPPLMGYLHTILQGYDDFGFDPKPLFAAADKARGKMRA